jgi:hypothetical protein
MEDGKRKDPYSDPIFFLNGYTAVAEHGRTTLASSCATLLILDESNKSRSTRQGIISK